MWFHQKLTFLLLLICQGSIGQDVFNGGCENCTCLRSSANDYLDLDPYYEMPGSMPYDSVDCAGKGLHDYPAFFSKLRKELRLHIDLSQNPLYHSRVHENDVSGKRSICRILPELVSISLAQDGIKQLGSIFRDCETVREIDLSGNRLENVMASDLPNSVHVLNLETDRLAPGVFINKTDLEKLTLVYHAETFEASLLEGLDHLIELKLILTNCERLSGLKVLPTLGNLTLRGDKISFLSPSLYSTLPGLEFLSLDLPQFHQMSLDTGSEYKLQKLQTLEIKNVKSLTKLPTFPALKSVYLEGISGLPQNQLSEHNPTIQTLHIVKCPMSEIPPAWLSTMTWLHELNLSHNNITSISRDAFTRLEVLENLNLGHNMLETASVILPPSLKLLVLSDNRIEVLETNFLPNLPKLVALDLSGNRISHIEPGAFAGLPQIRHIYLKNNRISKLDDYLFSGLPLKRLHLSRNSLTAMTDVFINSDVQFLDLQHNSIQHLPQEMVCSMNELEYLDLGNNPIGCHCLTACLREKKILLHGTCNTPQSLRGEYIAALETCTNASLQSTSPPLEESGRETTNSLSTYILDTAGNQEVGFEIMTPASHSASNHQVAGSISETEVTRKEEILNVIIEKGIDKRSGIDDQLESNNVTQSIDQENIGTTESHSESTPTHGTVVTHPPSVETTEGHGQPTLESINVVTNQPTDATENQSKPTQGNGNEVTHQLTAETTEKYVQSTLESTLNSVTNQPTDATENHSEPTVDNVSVVTHQNFETTESYGQPTLESINVVTNQPLDATEIQSIPKVDNVSVATHQPTVETTESYWQPTLYNGNVATHQQTFEITESYGQPTLQSINVVTNQPLDATEIQSIPKVDNVSVATHQPTFETTESYWQPTLYNGNVATHQQTFEITESYGQPTLESINVVTNPPTNATENHSKPTVDNASVATQPTVETTESYGQPALDIASEATHDAINVTEGLHQYQQCCATEETQGPSVTAEGRDESLQGGSAETPHEPSLVSEDQGQLEPGNLTQDQNPLEPGEVTVVTNNNKEKQAQGDELVSAKISQHPNISSSYPSVHQMEAENLVPSLNLSLTSSGNLESESNMTTFNDQLAEMANLSSSNNTGQTDTIGTKTSNSLVSGKPTPSSLSHQIGNVGFTACNPALIISLLIVIAILTAILAIACLYMRYRDRGSYDMAKHESLQQDEGKDILLGEARPERYPREGGKYVVCSEVGSDGDKVLDAEYESSFQH
ncbi:hypothetical protein EGW08_006232 [Elysia chlorotica]|uniref:LRRCT domain-containing protein n=1 Tax=Elysia chlorotica TaxID=188477 RepID=A0A3S1BDS2_ELYCH|nr:hypothetical protein EGW08_006232 [Elysia chlorotica]